MEYKVQIDDNSYVVEIPCESIDYLCQCMSMLVLMQLEELANIFDRVSRIFG